MHDGDVAALTPTPVPFPVSARFDKHFVVCVAAGKHHTLAVTRRGAVFSWGRGADGRLGYDARDADGDPKPTPSGSTRDVPGRDDAYQRTPRLVAGALRDAFAVDVAAANRHSAVVTRAGEVFAFGSNAFGQLGTRARARAGARDARDAAFGERGALLFPERVFQRTRARRAFVRVAVQSRISGIVPEASPCVRGVPSWSLRSRGGERFERNRTGTNERTVRVVAQGG